MFSNDYRRLKGLSKVERDDIVVFGFPHGDTILKAAPMDDYYTHVRINGRAYTEKMYGPIVVRPNDKKDNYVKRCVAIAGDTLSVVNGKVIVNGVPQKDIEGIQNTYTVYTNGTTINPKVMQKLDINPDDYYYDSSLPGYPALPLTQEAYKQVVAMVNVVEVRQNIDVYPPEYPDSPIMLFPLSENYKWTRDNYGPIWIPKAGATTEINANNYHLYQRIITAYEGNTFEVKDGKIYINGQQSNTYTFKQDYYFMMGDNRHNSLDSRYWGFVPEDHIVGTPAIIWFSTDKNKSFPSNIRWNRLFNFI